MSDPADDDELVNDDELEFERAPAAAPAMSSAPKPTGVRTSMPPPLPPPPAQPRISKPAPAAAAHCEEPRHPIREESRYPTREESRYPTREESRYPTREESRHPSREESRYPSREESRYPSREESRYPSREESRYPAPSVSTRVDPRHPPPQVDTRHPPQVDTRHPPQVESRYLPQVETRHPPQVESRHPPQVESYHPPHVDSRHPPQVDSRHPPQLDSYHPPPQMDSRQPSYVDSRYPSRLDELRPASRDERGVREDVPLQPGDVIAGKYQVERVVGRVGVGIVAQVRHADLGQRFRLKYLPLELCEAPDSVSRFLRGARRAMRLQSEHTARTIDAGRLASGAPYVVTEANAGSDLREVMRVRGVLTVNEAVDFVLQASESLAEAHAQGLIHKNLNLSTLFVTWRPDGSHSVKVQDFGVAESLRADPLRTSDFNGEPVTMFDSNPLEALGCLSPEQIRSSPEIDGGADVWALGCILHQLLSGFPAFAATSVPGLLASIVADPATPITAVRSDIPAGLENVILRCLEKNRGARFPSVADLANALRHFASMDAQASVDRITRTLGRAQQMAPGMERQFALVHVGPAAASHPPSPPISARTAVVPYPLIWSVALIAVGLIGGIIAGVLVVTRLPTQQAVLESRLNAQQPERNEPQKLVPVASEAVKSPPPSVAQPPVAALVPVAPPVVAPAVRPNVPLVVVARARTSQRPKEAASSSKSTPTGDSAPTANLGKDLFESVR